MNVKQTIFYQSMDDLNLYMKDKNLPLELCQRLREFVRYRRDVMVLNEHILHNLSPGLRAEVLVFTNREWLNKVPFFISCPEEFIVEVSTVLQSMTLAPNETVFRAGEYADCMFIVERGMVGIKGRLCTRGKIFGEDALLNVSGGRRMYNAVTLTHAMLYTLSRDDLMFFVDQFPEVEKNLRKATIRAVLKNHILNYTHAVKAMMKGRPLTDLERQAMFPGDDDTVIAAKSILTKRIAELQLLDPRSYVRLVVATKRLQIIFRRYRHRQRLKRVKRAVALIQRMVRAWLERRRVAEEEEKKQKRMTERLSLKMGRDTIAGTLDDDSEEQDQKLRDATPKMADVCQCLGQIVGSMHRMEKKLEALNARSLYQDRMLASLDTKLLGLAKENLELRSQVEHIQDCMPSTGRPNLNASSSSVGLQHSRSSAIGRQPIAKTPSRSSIQLSSINSSSEATRGTGGIHARKSFGRTMGVGVVTEGQDPSRIF
mmetsp:Transcript_27437/g.33331  ORF Transcript_27437/g.33331 Transcript_27437/m.33331 type:complete len:485 (-) Transcript_27437:628-2082(-)